MWNPLKNKSQKKLKLLTATDSDVEFAKRVVDTYFTPILKRNIESLNKLLAERGVRAGIEINWIFDKVQKEDG